MTTKTYTCQWLRQVVFLPLTPILFALRPESKNTPVSVTIIKSDILIGSATYNLHQTREWQRQHRFPGYGEEYLCLHHMHMELSHQLYCKHLY